MFRKSETGGAPVSCSAPMVGHDGRTESCPFSNSCCTLRDYPGPNSTNADLINATDIAHAVAQAFPAPLAPSERGLLVASALADEPWWPAPFEGGVTIPVKTSTVVRQRWIEYLKRQSLTASDFGVASWEQVLPMFSHPNTSSPLSLPSRVRFYWTVRFSHWDSCQYMATWTKALQEASGDPRLQTYVNFNNFDSRLYYPGHGPERPAVTAQLSYVSTATVCHGAMCVFDSSLLPGLV